MSEVATPMKLLALVLAFPGSVLAMSWLDSVLFGGSLIQYVVGTTIELGGVLAGVLIGYTIWGMKEVDDPLPVLDHI